MLSGESENNQIQGNLVGTQADGTSSLGNLRWGIGSLVPVYSAGNVLGGATPNSGNVIAHNGDLGVLIANGTGFSVLGNSIYDNGALGIDISPQPGVTANDGGDVDSGANRLQNFPVITLATEAGGMTSLQGSLNSEASTSFRLEFFANSGCDPSGHGEGQILLGTTDVLTDNLGDAAFSLSFASPTGGSQFVSATATHSDGSTSEFAACVPVSDNDSDGDGTPDNQDGCPFDPGKIAPGACGCGVPDTDSDSDGTPDCLDSCPTDPLKIEPGTCGCGVPDTDTDNDGVADCLDGCPGVPDVDAAEDGFLVCNDCNDSDPFVNPAAAETCDGIDNNCNGVVDDDLASLQVTANLHTVGSGSHPGSNKEPLVGLPVGIYDKSESSCSRTVCGGISWQNYACIYQGCSPIQPEMSTDPNGIVTFQLPPGDYLVIGGDGTDKHLGVSASDLACTDPMQKHLQRLQTANGKQHPGKTSRRTGSELLVIEPEFMEWSGQDELYPIVLESLGDWNVTTSVEPPEGFVADHASLSEDVDNEIEAIQFTITDVGSDWIPTQLKHVVQHGGRREIVLSRVGVKLTPELAHQRGLDVHGHALDSKGKAKPETRFNPRLPRPAEIVGWIEPSEVDPDWIVKLRVNESAQILLAITRGQGLIVETIYSGVLDPGEYELEIETELYERRAQRGRYFLTLRAGEMIQKSPLE